MKKACLLNTVEIDEYLPKLDQALRNFTLLAAGEIYPDEISELSLKDLANLSLLREDLKELKEDLEAESDNCQVCSEKDLLIREKDSHINDLKGINKDQLEIIKNQRRQIEALEKALNPAKIEVSE